MKNFFLPSSNQQKSSLRNWLGMIGRLVIGFALLGVLFYKAGFARTLTQLQSISFSWFMLAFLVYLSSVFVRAYRWKGLLDALGLSVSYRQLNWLYFVGFFFNQFIPTGIGGDLAKVYILGKDKAGGVMAANSVLMDRATGIYSLLLIGTAVILWQPEFTSFKAALLVVSLTAVITVGWIVFFYSAGWLKAQQWRWLEENRIGKIIKKFYTSFSAYDKRALAQALLVSTVFNFQLIITNILLAKACGIEINIWYFFVFTPLISLTLIAPLSINGLGTREWAYVLLFGQVGVKEPVALALSLSFFATNLILGLIGGVMFTFKGMDSEDTATESVSVGK